MHYSLFTVLTQLLLCAHIVTAQGPLGWMSTSTREALARDLIQAWDEQDRALSNLNWKEVKSFKISFFLFFGLKSICLTNASNMANISFMERTQ